MGLMSESVPVRCPACRREHVYAAPSYPCVCGAPVAPPLDQRGVATVVTHRVWDEDWIAVRCAACGRLDEWPYPELGCPCGTLLRIPVAGEEPTSEPAVRTTRLGADVRGRPAFQPVTIRTARDAVTAAALYLRWLGYRDIRLAARGILAQVDPTVRPASLRDVECLWLTAMTESTECVYFSLAGYADDARAHADTLGVPLFVLDLTGTPQPVNDLADQLDAAGS
jgi:hypothetical protein